MPILYVLLSQSLNNNIVEREIRIVLLLCIYGNFLLQMFLLRVYYRNKFT